MTVHSYLEKPNKLKEEIDDKQDELEQYRDMILRLKAIVYEQDRVQNNNTNDKISEAISKLNELEIEIDKMISEYIIIKEKLSNEIKDIDNDKERKVLYYLYIKKMPPIKISEVMDLTIGHVYKIRKQAIENFKNKYMI